MATETEGNVSAQLAQIQIVLDILARQLCLLDQHQKPEMLKALYLARKSFEKEAQTTDCIDRVMAFISHGEPRAAPH